MSFWTNLFSGIGYTKIGGTVIRDDGKTYYKTGDMWIDDEGSTIQQRDDEFFNLNTGVSSKWGDPFGDKE